MRDIGFTGLSLLAVAVAAWGCSECKNSTDCPIGEVCRGGECVPNPSPDTGTDTETDTTVDPGDTGTDGDVPDTGEDSIVPDSTTDTSDVPTDTADASDIPELVFCETDGDCDDGNECTLDDCHDLGGYCQWVNNDGHLCDDGFICNGIESCIDMVCAAGDPPLCEDPNPCVEGACDEGIGGCDWWTLADGSSCDNGIMCDGTDECLEGYCQPNYDFRCDDHNPCTDDSCDLATDTCVYEDVPFDGTVVTCGSHNISYVSGASDRMNNYDCGGTSYLGYTSESFFRIDLGSTPTTLEITIDVEPEDPTVFDVFFLTDICDPTSCIHHGGKTTSMSGLTGTVFFTVERDTFGAAWVDVACL